MESLSSLFKKFSTIKVGVIRDVMLDSYYWGKVERISPEAPVPVVSVSKKELRIGGAGNVALNLRSLGAEPFVISVFGNDEEGKMLNRLFAGEHINTNYSIHSENRITTNKIRVIGRNQQMLRLDAEATDDLISTDEAALIDRFERFVQEEKPDVVILEDYNKGVLSEAVIRVVISVCKENGVVTAVDPKRKNFFAFRGVDIFKPNLKEVKDALNLITAEPVPHVMNSIHQQLQQLLHHRISLITLSEKGIFYMSGDTAGIIPSHLRNIADVSGAGDTVIAVAALVYAASRNVHLMADIANIAGGLVCEEVGTVAVDKTRLYNECELLLN
ncbi:MAG: bifunctional heptose 7-phosphate kinase/heptose 1-phosphate adenyltransferase [Flavisolibacter sp.]